MHHIPPPESQSPPPPPLNMNSIDDPSTSIWDWSQFLDFNIDDHLPLPPENTALSPVVIPTFQEDLLPVDDDHFPVTNYTNNNNTNNNYNNDDNNDIDSNNNNSNNNSVGRVRKRDPRMACSNFLAGRIPCACPELDAQLAAEEEERQAAAKKKKRTVTNGTGSRCQVPDCEVDISQLKGYHKRHRVCLTCATATCVFLDGANKRYCQQCGKFHVLSDFDEGKRSCRRKLERHNNRRRRKSSESKGSGLQSVDYDDGYDEAKKGIKPTSSELAGEKPFLAAEGHITTPSSIHSQNIQSDSIASLPVSGETQSDEEKEKGTDSPSLCDNKSAFSSMCTTGRISFKLYDWNPAEFPRRLRHQIFQWLATMPVELEGYIRPGCTILTIFIAMPKFMWVKLSEDPVVCIHDLLASPRNLLSGRDTFFVSLNSMIFSVMKGGRSVIKVKQGEKSPKLHYVQPTFFEAGKPIEFLACGSNLIQPRLRFLVSFAGKYMTNNVSVVPSSKKQKASTTNFDQQFLNICVPRTELDVFGPGFIEVENESGLSNFVPIIIADQEVCSEIKRMQMKYYSTFHSQDVESTSTTSSCEVAVNKFSELLVDIAWILKHPVIEDTECDIMSSQLHRFNFVINFLIAYESSVVLKRVLHCVKMRMIKYGDIDGTLLQGTVNHAIEILNQRLQKKVNLGLHPRDNLAKEDDVSYKEQLHPFISIVNQDIEKSEKFALLNDDCVMSVTPYKEQLERPSNRAFTYYNTSRLFTPRPLILSVALVTLCFGICAVVLHPQKATAIAVTIHRCLFDDK